MSDQNWWDAAPLADDKQPATPKQPENFWESAPLADQPATTIPKNQTQGYQETPAGGLGAGEAPAAGNTAGQPAAPDIREDPSTKAWKIIDGQEYTRHQNGTIYKVTRDAQGGMADIQPIVDEKISRELGGKGGSKRGVASAEADQWAREQTQAAPTIGERATNFAVGVPRGAISTVGTMTKGLATGGLSDPGRILPVISELESAAQWDNQQTADYLQRASKALARSPQISRQLPGSIALLRSGKAKSLQDLPELQKAFQDAIRDPRQTEAYALGQSLQDYAKQQFAGDPRLAENLETKVSEGFGSVGAFILPALLPGGQGFAAGAGMLAGQGEALENAVDALENGEALSRKQLLDATGLGMLPGATESIPIETLLERIPKPKWAEAMGAIGRIVAQAAIEGGQEAVQQVGQNLISKYVYRPDQAVTEGVGEAALIGGIVGAGVQTIAEGGKAVVNRGGKQDKEGPQKADNFGKRRIGQTVNVDAKGDAQPVTRVAPGARPERQFEADNRPQQIKDRQAQAILGEMGYTPDQIREMNPDEFSAALQEASDAGVEAPTREPAGDIAAQVKDLVDPANPRQSVFLPRDTVDQMQKAGQLAAAKKAGVVLEDFDGRGGMIIARDEEVAKVAKEAKAAGVPMQQIIGRLTGSGTGKPVDGDTVVQQRDEQGNVTRETLTTSGQAQAVMQDFAQPGRQVVTMTPDEALVDRDTRASQELAGTRNAPVKAETAEDIDTAAQQAAAQPSDGQKTAGNYKHAHVNVQGIDIAIETPKGKVRTGTDPDGNQWETTMPAHYGRIKRTEGADGDQVDVYIGDDVQSDVVYIVDQNDPATGEFDEHKVIMGTSSMPAAMDLYTKGFSDGSGLSRLGGIRALSVRQFKEWLKGDTRAPAVGTAPKAPPRTRQPADAADAAVVAPAPQDAAAQLAAEPASAPEASVETGTEIGQRDDSRADQPDQGGTVEAAGQPAGSETERRKRFSEYLKSGKTLAIDKVAKAIDLPIRDVARMLQDAARDGALIYTKSGKFRRVGTSNKPMGLIEALTKAGGIRDDGGELAAMDLDKKFGPGGRLVRTNGGMTLDEAREWAVENGYIKDTPYEDGLATSTVRDLLDALREDAAGNKQVAEQDIDRQLAADEQERQRQEQDRLTATPQQKAIYDAHGMEFAAALDDWLTGAELTISSVPAADMDRAAELFADGMNIDDAVERAFIEAVEADTGSAYDAPDVAFDPFAPGPSDEVLPTDPFADREGSGKGRQERDGPAAPDETAGRREDGEGTRQGGQQEAVRTNYAAEDKLPDWEPEVSISNKDFDARVWVGRTEGADGIVEAVFAFNDRVLGYDHANTHYSIRATTQEDAIYAGVSAILDQIESAISNIEYGRQKNGTVEQYQKIAELVRKDLPTGKGPWPNSAGVFGLNEGDDVKTVRMDLPGKRNYAEIEAIELRDGKWITAFSYSITDAGGGSGLSVTKGQIYESQDEAVSRQAERELPQFDRPSSMSSDAINKQRKQIADWLKTLVKSKPTTEKGADGKDQAVIPGAEQDVKGALQNAADKPLKPKADQKPMDDGLFGDSMNQSDLFDAPKTETPKKEGGRLDKFRTFLDGDFSPQRANAELGKPNASVVPVLRELAAEETDYERLGMLRSVTRWARGIVVDRRPSQADFKGKGKDEALRKAVADWEMRDSKFESVDQAIERKMADAMTKAERAAKMKSGDTVRFKAEDFGLYDGRSGRELKGTIEGTYSRSDGAASGSITPAPGFPGETGIMFVGAEEVSRLEKLDVTANEAGRAAPIQAMGRKVFLTDEGKLSSDVKQVIVEVGVPNNPDANANERMRAVIDGVYDSPMAAGFEFNMVRGRGVRLVDYDGKPLWVSAEQIRGDEVRIREDKSPPPLTDDLVAESAVDVDALIDSAIDDVFASPADPLQAEIEAEKELQRRGKKTVKQSAASAVRNVGQGLNEVLNGLNALFNDPNKLGSGPSFDEATYQKAKPHFRAGAAHFAAAGRDIAEMVRSLVQFLASSGMDRPALERMKPYIARFIKDVQSGKETIDVSGSSLDLEQDSGQPATGDRLGEANVSPAGRPAGRSPDTGGSPNYPRNERADRSGSVSEGDAPVVGSRGDLAIPDPQPEPEPFTPTDRDGGRSSADRVEGLSAERIPAAEVAAAATDSADVEVRRRQQARAESIAVIPEDADNIAQTLPMLYPDQRDDVLKAERRFADANGFLLTNGTGTGKTFSGAGVIKRLAKQGKTNQLIVAPSQGILEAWAKALKDMQLDVSVLESTSTSGDGIVLTTYANLANNRTLADREWDLVTSDEAHTLLQNEDGEETAALKSFRAITRHPRGHYQRAIMLHRDLYGQIEALRDQINAMKAMDGGPANMESMEDRLSELYSKFSQKVNEVQRDMEAKPRSKALFLSATPFAHHYTLDWAEGYLFDYPQGGDPSAYNAGDGRARFFMENFGYRMRYNKLTKPESDVNSEIMEREFHERLKKTGALSGRMISVDKDYDRKFVDVVDAKGKLIDRGFKWLHDNDAYELAEAYRKRFAYLPRARLLEAMKAKGSEAYIRQSLDMGRKVVAFHNFNEGGGFVVFPESDNDVEITKTRDGQTYTTTMKEQYQRFKAANPYIEDLNFSDYMAPPAEIKRMFGDRVAIYNGTVSAKERSKALKQFNQKGSGIDVLVVQADAGSAGLSAHDTVGDAQRVLINYGLPTKPTQAIQQEGRIYRDGQASDAIFRYLNTGTSWERSTFASTIAQRAGTAENLGMGNLARTLKQSFIDAYEDSGDYPPGHAGEGTGGKDIDRAMREDISEFERAKTHYWAQQKKSGRRDQREGVDYFATPEPVGLKLVEFIRPRANDRMLEPSAGHGAIARYLPESTTNTIIEPSEELLSRAQLRTPNAKPLQQQFESLNIVNKFDGIVMNPPFGSGGKTAIDHLAKAVKHLRNGGRVAAIIPTGPAADKKFDTWYEGVESVYMVAEILLPSVTFKRAGTGVMTRIVVLEKQTDENVQPPQQIKRDYTRVEDINELFDRIEQVELAERAVPETQEFEVPPDGNFNAGGIDFELDARNGADVAVVKSFIGGKFKYVVGVAQKHGGTWNNRAAMFEFTSPGARAEFLQDLEANPEPAPVEAPSGVKFDVNETMHAKTGAKLWVASIVDRVERDVYEAINEVAKRHGGYYSSYRGRGAIPGFQFKSQETRQKFLDEMQGKTTPPAAPQTPRGQDVTSTPAFQNWFGNSKVVDGQGKPLAVYHGTAQRSYEQPFDTFKGMVWASRDMSLAAKYADMREAIIGPSAQWRMITGHMRVERPFNADRLNNAVTIEDVAAALIEQADQQGRPLSKSDVQKFDDLAATVRRAARREESGPHYSRHDFWFEPETLFGLDGAQAVRRMFEIAGFDGVSMLEDGSQTFGAFSSNQFKSVNNRGTFDPANPSIMAQVARDPAPVFYSALERAVEGMQQPRAPKAQWMAMIRNAQGVKPEEIDWIGLPQWLAEQSGTIEKDAVLDFIRANQIEIKEVLKGSDLDPNNPNAGNDAIARLTVELDNFLNQNDYANQSADELRLKLMNDRDEYARGSDEWNLIDDHIEWLADFEERWDAAESMETGERTDATPQYEAYQLSGGENYREMLLTLPVQQPADGKLPLKSNLEVRQANTGWNLWDRAADGGRGDWVYRNDFASADEVLANAQLDEMLIDKNFGVQYKSNHWDEPNIVAHVRFNEREQAVPYTAEEQAAIDARKAAEPELNRLFNELGDAITAARRERQPMREARKKAVDDRMRSGEITDMGEYKRLLQEAEFGDMEDTPALIRQREVHEQREALLKSLPPMPKQKTTRTLFIEEIQSDWHQQGRKKGYKQAPLTSLPEGWRVGPDGPGSWNVWSPDGIARATGSASEQQAVRNALSSINNSNAVPDAPFKTTWPELAFKRMLRWAVDNGYDRIAWTPGQVQADRYDLSKQVSRVTFEDNPSMGIQRPFMDGPPSRGVLRAYDLNGRKVLDENIDPEDVQDYIGKEAADKLLSVKPIEASNAGLGVRFRALDGLDLQVGGEGMKGFYDQILPKTVAKLTKKWGGQVSASEIRTKYEVFVVDTGKVIAEYVAEVDAQTTARNAGDNVKYRPKRQQVWSLDITDAMREAAKQGLPLFQKRAKREANPLHQRIVDDRELNQVAGEIQKIAERVLGRSLREVKYVVSRGDGNMGSYDFMTGTIDVALQMAMRPDITIRHEAIHALRRAGVITRTEWAVLERQAKRWRKQYQIDDRYRAYLDQYSYWYDSPELRESHLNEEAVAEAFSDFFLDRADIQDSRVRKVFARIKRFIEQVQNLLAGHGFTSAEQIFGDIEEGRIGQRTPRATQAQAMPLYADDMPRPQRAAPKVETPTANEPQLMQAPTETDAFKRWFGDSKVVDAEGKPLMVYHGTIGNIDEFADVMGRQGFYFAEDPAYANVFAGATGKEAPAFGNNVLPVYLSMQKPADLSVPNEALAAELDTVGYAGYRLLDRDVQDRWELFDGYSDLREALEKLGYDGVKLREPDYDGKPYASWMVFSPNQVKSAFNRGTFDPSDPRILAQVPRNVIPTRARINNMLTRTSGDLKRFSTAVRRKMQDRFIDVKNLQEYLTQVSGEAIREFQDVYLAESLYYGKTGKRLDDLREEVFEPIMAKIQSHNLALEEVDEFLYARHAKERNARIASINPNMPEAGSGMTDAEADAVIDAFRRRNRLAALEDVAADIDKLVDDTRRGLLKDGLISQEMYDQWRQYDYYVPLRGWESDPQKDGEPDIPRVGRRFDIRGKEAKTAFGRQSRADSPLAYVMMQAQQAVIRGEKNRVGKAFLRLVQANPDKAMWEIHPRKKVRYLNKTTGLVQEKWTADDYADDVFSVKIGGNPTYIKIKDPEIAKAMKGLGATNLNGFNKVLHHVNRYLSFMSTQANPEFVLTNFARDIQTAGINLAQAEVKGLQKAVMRDAGKAMKGVWQGLAGDRTSEWARYYHEFADAGGKIGFFGLDTIEDQKKNMRRELNKLRPGASQQAWNFVEKAFKRGILDSNSAVENAMRLSTYVNARRAGLTKAKAASLARELTVNFNRRGEWGTAMNAYYLFYNAGIQGTVRMFQAMRSPKVRALVYGVIGSAFMLDIINRLMAGDDDDGENFYDKIPTWEKERNWIFMLPGGKGEYMKFPMPWGFNVFAVMGQQTAATMFGKETPGSAAFNIGKAGLNAFNPIGGSDRIERMLSPTLLDPFVDMAANKDYLDRKIMPEDYPGQVPSPDSQKYWSTVNPHLRKAAEKLNEMELFGLLEGGNEVRPGAIDISPETMEYWTDFVGGGAGAFVSRSYNFLLKLQRGDDIEAYQVPFTRRFYGSPSKYQEMQAYYDIRDEVLLTEKEFKLFKERGLTDEIRAARERPEFKMINRVKQTDNSLRQLRKQVRALEAQQGMDEQMKKRRIEQLENRMLTIMEAARSQYNQLKE